LSISIFSNILKYDIILLVSIWGILYALRFLSLSIVYDILLRREFRVELPYSKIFGYFLKFIIACLPMVIVRYLVPVPFTGSVYYLVYRLLINGIISLVLYVILLYILDYKMRDLISRIIAYIRFHLK